MDPESLVFSSQLLLNHCFFAYNRRIAKMKSLALSLLGLAATVIATPTPPTFTYLYSVNLTIPAAANIDLGSVPLGTRSILSITGGTFWGPKLTGQS